MQYGQNTRNAISGRSVARAIAQAVRGVQGELERSLRSAHELDQQVGQLVERRGEVLLELARHYLPNFDQATVSQTFAEVRGDIIEVLRKKKEHEQELTDSITRDVEQERKLQESLDQITEKLNDKVARREELEKEVAKLLDTDAEFQRLSQKALAAEQELNRNEERVAEIKAEAARKLPSYEKSRLFRYLHDRGFGTSDYKKTGTIKKLDKWVARMIDYHRARRGYDFLRVTPELIAKEVGRRRDEFNGLMEQVEAIEDRHADQVGLTDVMREGQRLGAERDRIVAAISGQQATTDKHRQELVSLQGTENLYYVQAVDRMKDFLSRLDGWRLERASQATPERDDDRLVDEIKRIDEDMESRRTDVRALGDEQNMWKERSEGLQHVLHDFHRSEFDSGRSIFRPDFRIDQLLDNYLRKQLSNRDLWDMIRAAQQFAPPWYEDTGRDVGHALDSDFSYVLLRVLADIAGQALRSAAYRGMQRRGPIRQRNRLESGKPNLGNRRFTKGPGF